MECAACLVPFTLDAVQDSGLVLFCWGVSRMNVEISMRIGVFCGIINYTDKLYEATVYEGEPCCE
jgi:hypothetical protein